MSRGRISCSDAWTTRCPGGVAGARPRRLRSTCCDRRERDLAARRRRGAGLGGARRGARTAWTRLSASRARRATARDEASDAASSRRLSARMPSSVGGATAGRPAAGGLALRSSESHYEAAPRRALSGRTCCRSSYSSGARRPQAEQGARPTQPGLIGVGEGAASKSS